MRTFLLPQRVSRNAGSHALGQVSIVVLDEILVAVHLKVLSEEAVLEFLDASRTLSSRPHGKVRHTRSRPQGRSCHRDDGTEALLQPRDPGAGGIEK